jgi:multiple sugar transport system substrate-binding protein
VGVLAKDGSPVARPDLATNEFSAKDPRQVAVNEVAGKGKTPVALNFQQAFNAPGSPWLTLVRNAVLKGSDSVDADNDEITAVLSQ